MLHKYWFWRHYDDYDGDNDDADDVENRSDNANIGLLLVVVLVAVLSETKVADLDDVVLRQEYVSGG